MSDRVSDCLSEETIARFVDGGLTESELAAAEDHIAGCDACMAMVGDVGNAVTNDPPSERFFAKMGTKALERGAQVGRYVILGTLGEGAMGRVYSAHDPALDRKVALKLLHPHLATADLETRLLREAKAMARLSHPEVITVHDAGKHGDQIFLAMELVEGGTLRQWLNAKPRSWREVLDVYVRAGRGLAQAHTAGIVHRDFKPDNVLVGADGRVRVTDFGLARAGAVAAAAAEEHDSTMESTQVPSGSPPIDANLTQTGTLLGTPAYMAPDQLMGRPADVRSDVYSYAVALYEGLYGERPFGAKSLLDLHREKEKGEVRPAPPNRRVPPRLRRAIVRALRPKPEDRYASMDAMLDALAASTRFPRAPIAIATALVAIGGASIALGSRGSHATAPVVAQPTCSVETCAAKHPGEAYVCRASDQACVPVASEDCVPTFEPGDLVARDTVWLGAMFPTKGDNAKAFGTMNADGAELARKEIASATSALAGAGASMHVRRIGLVTCDDGKDPMRAARHLVEDVGVPAILGFSSGKEIEDVAGSLLIKRKVVTMATLSTSPLITRLPQPADLPRMVWRTTFSIESAADATAQIVHDTIEPRGRATHDETRVAFVRADTRGGTWFGEALYKRLVFNGKPAVENGAAYREILLDVSPSPEQVTRAIDTIIASEPTIVLLFASPDATDVLIDRVEAGWHAHARRPTYFLADDSVARLSRFIGASADRRHRVFGFEPTSSETALARFVMRFDAAHPGEATRETNPAPAYDAFYVLAYGAFALGSAPVSGPEVARAIGRLVSPGRAIETGPSGVLDALSTLDGGGNVDLVGPSGGLDFDVATGETGTDFALICSKVGRAGRADGEVESGLVYRWRSGKVEGTMRCR